MKQTDKLTCEQIDNRIREILSGAYSSGFRQLTDYESDELYFLQKARAKILATVPVRN